MKRDVLYRVEVHGFALEEALKCGLMYCDPPWNQGMETLFRGNVGLPKSKTFLDLLRRIVEVGRNARYGAFIEMGAQELGNLDMAVREAGGRLSQTFRVTYCRRRPSFLVYAVWRSELDLLDAADGMDDSVTPLWALGKLERDGGFFRAIDPCCGRGLTVTSADMLGMPCAGIELDPRKMAVTVSLLMRSGNRMLEKDAI